jgi:Kef-type K+ transport system membrane component KefB
MKIISKILMGLGILGYILLYVLTIIFKDSNYVNLIVFIVGYISVLIFIGGYLVYVKSKKIEKKRSENLSSN